MNKKRVKLRKNTVTQLVHHIRGETLSTVDTKVILQAVGQDFIGKQG